MKKVVHYINQFFAGIGGEDTADLAPEIREGVVGPGSQLNKELEGAEVTHTIICGDNYMGSNTEEALEKIFELIEGIEFDLLVAGPAFQAGRYGVACGEIGKAVKEKLDIPVISSMHEENPGVDMFKKDIIITKGGHSAAAMKDDIAKMARVANDILAGEDVGTAEDYDYFHTGKRAQVFLESEELAADRGVEMMIKKLKGEEFQTELVIEPSDLVPIAPEIKDLGGARIALLNTGGIVPVDNPDHIQSASATRWGCYDIENADRLNAGEFKTIHAGFDPAAADGDPNRIMPVDVMKELLKEGVYGSLHPYFYSTVGTGTTEREAARMAQEIIPYLKEDDVDGAIMIST